MIRVEAIHIYPVKGLRGIPLSQAKLTPTGLENDRRWMIVMPNGRMVTQRQKAQLATLVPRFEEDCLVLAAPGYDDLKIPLALAQQTHTEVTIWRDTFIALDEGAAASAWLTRVLASDYSLRLVRMDPNIKRPQSKPEILGEECSTQFADAAPFLVTNRSSLEALNRTLIETDIEEVGMERFRPNIVLTGLNPWEEYQAKVLSQKAGHYSIGLRYPSERCNVVNTDQLSGQVHPQGQPLKTLKQMNTAPGHVGAFFGQNARLDSGQGAYISVGDELEFEK